MRAAAVALPLLLLSACAGGGQSDGTARWDGRRGYDGLGDYGYDVDASRAEATDYRARAASRSYPVPGKPDDPWGPYVHEAAARHAVPERWIREVLRQESGGRLRDASGSLITSPVGAMGLMQVMPATYDTLRRRYGLSDDAYEPHDNIMAGAAYIREMFDRFGAPAFLAAYNAGPDRVDAYLAGAAGLPDETVNYLAQVAPRLGGATPMTGPLAVYAGNGAAVRTAVYAPSAPPLPERGYAGDGYAAAAPAASEDSADRAFDGGGLVTAAVPTGVLTGTGQAASTPAAPAYAPRYDDPDDDGTVSGPLPLLRNSRPLAALPAPVLVPTVALALARPALTSPGRTWAVQVGAFPDPATARAAAEAARARAAGLLAGAQPAITAVRRGNSGGMLYRARLVGLSRDAAGATCAALSRGGAPCFTVPPGS